MSTGYQCNPKKATRKVSGRKQYGEAPIFPLKRSKMKREFSLWFMMIVPGLIVILIESLQLFYVGNINCHYFHDNGAIGGFICTSWMPISFDTLQRLTEKSILNLRRLCDANDKHLNRFLCDICHYLRREFID